MTLDDICSLINNYTGTQEETEIIVLGVKPVARSIACKFAQRVYGYTVDDLEALIYTGLLRWLHNKRDRVATKTYIYQMLYYSMIGGLRAENRMLQRYPDKREIPSGDITEVAIQWQYGRDNYLDDLARDLATLTLPVEPSTRDLYKRIFYKYVFCYMDAGSIAAQENRCTKVISNALNAVLKELCTIYGTNYNAARKLLRYYSATRHVARDKVHYGRLVECDIIQTPKDITDTD